MKPILSADMYDIMNCHKEYIVGRLGQKNNETNKNALETYSDLKNGLKGQNIKRNTVFKKTYVKFFGMGQSRLISDYYDRYFSLLEENKANRKVSLSWILNSLHSVSKTSKGRQTLQFSFATKMVHIINDDEPIYDSRIKLFFKMTEPPAEIEFNKRVEAYLDIQMSIKIEYDRIIKNKLLEPSIGYFRKVNENRSDHSDIKVIDWLIWQFVSLVNGGWIGGNDRGSR